MRDTYTNELVSSESEACTHLHADTCPHTPPAIAPSVPRLSIPSCLKAHIAAISLLPKPRGKGGWSAEGRFWGLAGSREAEESPSFPNFVLGVPNN
jgi:hypothetical protein